MDTRMQDIVKRLNEMARAYYELDAPIASDSEYDKLYDELCELERQTGVTLPGSPTRRVGGKPLERFEQHEHIGRLWSLDKIRSKSELIDWIKRTNKIITEYNERTGSNLPEVSYYVEYKFDGLTINLTYDEGKLV